MPLGQILINSLPLAAGICVKYGFFKKIGFGKEYVQGVKEGFATMRKCRKVAYSPANLPNYLSIQWELIMGTGIYVYEFLSRQLRKLI